MHCPPTDADPEPTDSEETNPSLDLDAAESTATPDIEDSQEVDPPYIAFLLMGIRHADAVTTVSPRYAEEVQTEEFGCGAEALLQETGVTGILNGVDPTEWTPSTDVHIAAPFSPENQDGRRLCRNELLRLAGWPEDTEDLILGAVTRLAHQKGLDWIAEAVPHLHTLGARLVILGTGDEALEEEFTRLGQLYPAVVHPLIRFDLKLSHQIYAGADAFWSPVALSPVDSLSSMPCSTALSPS